MMRPLIVTRNTFASEVLQSDKPVLVSWHAVVSDPVSRLVSPLVDQLAEKFEGHVKYVKVDAEDDPEFAWSWGVRRVPSMGFFREGSMVGPCTRVERMDHISARLEALTTTPLPALPPADRNPALPEGAPQFAA
jgi:thioredoxin 1